MKINITAFALFTFLIYLTISSIVNKPSAEINKAEAYPVLDKQFIIGAFHNGGVPIDHSWGNDYSKYSELNFNTWHTYCAPTNWGWRYDNADYYTNTTSNYYDAVHNVFTDNQNIMRTFMHRPVIEYLVGSQRIDYKCESVGNNYQADHYWFYAYNQSLIETNNMNYAVTDITDNINGTNEMVKYCNSLNESKIDNDILINSELRANREMSFNNVNPWMRDDEYNWYVLPKIKIDPYFASGTEHNNDVVCRIKVTGWDGTIQEEFDLMVKNFKDENGQYNGSYMESFYLNDQSFLSYLKIDKSKLQNFTSTDPDEFIFDWVNVSCGCDIKIYWTGVCDMWIDRVRIENEPAHQFMTLNDSWHNELIDKLETEIDWAQEQYNTSNPIPNYFYFEEAAFSHFPAIKELNNRIRTRTGNTNEMVIWLNYELFNVHVPYYYQNNWFGADKLLQYLHHDFGLNTIVMGSYALQGFTSGSGISYHPTTLTTSGYNVNANIFSFPASPGFYDTHLQLQLDNIYASGTSLTYVYKLMSELSKSGMRIINCPQAHSWYNEIHHILKEPSNEEIELQACLALTYNAKGIMYFCYDSDPFWHAFGIINSDGSKRTNSAYGQNKYEGIKSIDIKLSKWAPYVMLFDPQHTKSCVYRLSDERNQFTANSYFDEVRTELQNPQTQCAEIVPNTSYENPNNTYVQAATFKPINEPFTNYFMLLNRRCSPGDDDCSGRRFVKVVFSSDNTNELDGFNNWKIIDLEDNSVVTTFDKRISNIISLGKFKPAQGKLYKLVPVMVDGGTFVCDELVVATTVNCNGIVNTGGYNLNIPAINGLTTISFSQNGTIQGYNGTDFLIGGNNQVVLKAQNGNKWRGISVNNYSNADVFNAIFQDIGDVQSSSYWAMSFYNCNWSSVRSSQFILPPQAKGINVNNFALSDYSDVAIMNNYISTENSTAAVLVGCSSLGYCNLLIMDNVITNNTTQSTFGIFLSNTFSSYVDRNIITGYKYGLKLLNTTLEMNNNIISSSGIDNTSILATSSSTINMGLIGNLYIGGNNSFSNSGDNSRNISLSNSIFEMNYGNNNLNVNNVLENFNLVGNGNFSASDDGPIKFIEAIGNCFNGEGNNAIDSITDLDGLRYTLKEDPHNCNFQQDRIADFIAPVVNDIVDTVFKSTLSQFQNSSPSVTLYRDFYKSVMKRNYDSTKLLGTQLLTNYSDSITTADVISLLYFANTKLEDISANMQSLKTFLEQLIINHTQNLTLVRTSNYFIQKCKVHLHQYNSALDGYQDIIAQNPYSYEGLVASWDYASTLLLANAGGALSSNEEDNLNSLVFESQFLVDSLRMKRLMNIDKYDKKVFTLDDRKTLIKSVGDVLKDDRQKQIEKVKSLEEELNKSKGNNTSKVKQKLEEVKNLNSLIRTKRPKDAEEYKIIINNDIEKLFPKKSGSDSNPQILVPATYAFYQNYPNPFNPTTKIAYDLPRDTKVKLIIYDILGREVKTLVNNEFKTAGRYITEFNGSNLASGVFFARILVNEGKDFIAVKKMVLLK